MNNSSKRNAPNTRDEQVLCLHITDTLGKKLFLVVSLGTCAFFYLQQKQILVFHILAGSVKKTKDKAVRQA